MAQQAMRIVLIAFAHLIVVLFTHIAMAQPVEPGTDEKASASIDQLIEAIEDPAQRQVLVDRLRAAAAEPATTTTRIEDTVVEDALDTLHEKQKAIGSFVGSLAGQLNQFPYLASWLSDEWAQVERRAAWLDVGQKLLLVLMAGYILRIVVRLSIARFTERQWHAHPAYHLIRDLAGILALAIGSTVTLMTLTLPPSTFQAGSKVVLGAVVSRAAVVLLAAMLSPQRRFDNLIPIQDSTAKPLYRGLAMAARIGILFHFLLRAARDLGLPDDLFTFFQHVLYLAVALTLVITIVSVKEAAGNRILAWSESSEGWFKRLVPWTFLARHGHWLAIAWIITHYVVWSMQLPGGTVVLSRATIGTILIIALARLSLIAVDRLLNWSTVTSRDEDDLVSEVQERAARYLRPLRLILRVTIILASLLALAQIWNIGIIAWFGSPTGSAVLSTLMRIVLIAVIAVLLSETTASLATRYIEAKTEAGTPLHSNRSRTLASILRNIVIVAVVLVSVMLTLSELGVNAAALLAGAGVIGLAIGFGSQRLVQDLITGLFILMGDAIRVGDVVTVANLSGVVESMSMRTVTLRSYDGSVHTVPYSSIDTVTNMTKDYSFAVLDIGVDYKEDVDQVMQVLRDVDSELRRQWPYRRHILEPLDIAGVDLFADSSILIKARSKVRPGEQWGVRREFYRRIKIRFDELNITIPFPHQTVFFGADKAGKAPPLVIEQRRASLRAKEGGAEAAGPRNAETS